MNILNELEWSPIFLTHYQTTNFRLFQTEIVCRQQFQIWREWQQVIKRGRKLWEKEKLLVTSYFSFSHSVFKRFVSQGRQKVSSKGLFPRGVKRCHCVGMGWKLKARRLLKFRWKKFQWLTRFVRDVCTFFFCCYMSCAVGKEGLGFERICWMDWQILIQHGQRWYRLFAFSHFSVFQKNQRTSCFSLLSYVFFFPWIHFLFFTKRQMFRLDWKH